MKRKDSSVCLVGAGRAGRALAQILNEHGIEISLVVDKNKHRAEACGRICNAPFSDAAREIPLNTTFIFLALPDDKIALMAAELSCLLTFPSGVVAAHLSGLLPAETLSPLRERGALLGSFHPCLSFPAFEGEALSWDRLPIAVQGDPEAEERLKILAHSLGALPFLLTEKAKPFYHLACSLASNYLVSLLFAAQQCLDEAESALSLSYLFPLIRSTLNNIEQRGVEAALSGSIQRGDRETVASHLRVLRDHLPGLLPSYKALAEITLQLAKESGTDPGKLSSISTLLAADE